MKLHETVAAAMATAATPTYHGKAPRDNTTYPYTRWVLDTIVQADTAGALCSFAITCDTFARDSATKSGAEQATEAANALDAVFQRAHLHAADLSGASSLVIRADRGWVPDPEDEGIAWLRTVYNGEWVDRA